VGHKLTTVNKRDSLLLLLLLLFLSGQPVRLLGTGGFGEVYLCRWHSFLLHFRPHPSLN
jgi:hypothetical protein